MNMAVTPTNWSLIKETTRADKNRSTMLTAIQRVSGNMWYRKWTWRSQSIKVVRMPLSQVILLDHDDLDSKTSAVQTHQSISCWWSM